MNSPRPPLPLPDGVRSRHIAIATGLDMHVLEAGYEGAATDKPLLLLLKLLLMEIPRQLLQQPLQPQRQFVLTMAIIFQL